MSSTRDQLLTDIKAFLERTDVTPTDFGIKSIGDPNLMRRLRNGKDVTLCTADRIRSFMRDYKQARPKSRPLAGAAA